MVGSCRCVVVGEGILSAVKYYGSLVFVSVFLVTIPLWVGEEDEKTSSSLQRLLCVTQMTIWCPGNKWWYHCFFTLESFTMSPFSRIFTRVLYMHYSLAMVPVIYGVRRY